MTFLILVPVTNSPEPFATYRDAPDPDYAVRMARQEALRAGYTPTRERAVVERQPA